MSLPDLLIKLEHPVKFKFQINNEQLFSISTSHVFYLVMLVIGFLFLFFFLIEFAVKRLLAYFLDVILETKLRNLYLSQLNFIP